MSNNELRPPGVPSRAMAVEYKSANNSGTYWVWPQIDRSDKIVSWRWHATGIEGERLTFDEACAAARRRMKDGEYEKQTYLPRQ